MLAGAGGTQHATAGASSLAAKIEPHQPEKASGSGVTDNASRSQCIDHRLMRRMLLDSGSRKRWIRREVRFDPTEGFDHGLEGRPGFQTPQPRGFLLGNQRIAGKGASEPMRDQRLDGEIGNRHRRLVSLANRARADLLTEGSCEDGGLADRAKRDVAFVLPSTHTVTQDVS